MFSKHLNFIVYVPRVTFHFTAVNSLLQNFSWLSQDLQLKSELLHLVQAFEPYTKM